jgi:hypothetical protein
MKKYILILAILLTSCTATVEEPKGSGYWVVGDGEDKFINASDDYTDIYMSWVEAHNEKDIEKVLSFETDNIRVDLPDGTFIEGKEAHSEALEGYFDLNPELNVYWALPYVGLVSNETWIIAGQVENFDDNQTRLLMADAQFTEGKLSRVIFYEKAQPTQSE